MTWVSFEKFKILIGKLLGLFAQFSVMKPEFG